jgi:hypothetical protein
VGLRTFIESVLDSNNECSDFSDDETESVKKSLLIFLNLILRSKAKLQMTGPTAGPFFPLNSLLAVRITLDSIS